MFRWLKKKLGIGRNQTWDIFFYWDGKRQCSADPAIIERALIAILGEQWRDKVTSLAKRITPGVVGVQLEELRENKEKLRSEILYAIDTAFNVRAYDGSTGEGMTEAQRLGLLNGYMQWIIALIVESRNFMRQQSRASPSPVN